MWKRIFFAASLLLGLSLFVLVVTKFGGFEETLEIVGRTGWLGLTLFIANAALTLVMPGIGWWILMRGEGLHVTLWTTIRANFMGFPINFIAPTLYLGSEPLKMVYVSQVHGEPKRRVLATIIVAKFQEVGALLIVMIVAAVIAFLKIDLTPKEKAVLVVSMLFLLALFGFLLYSFVGNWKPTVKFINFLAAMGIAKRKLARLRTRAREMEHIVRQAFTRRWKTFVLSQLVTTCSSVAILMRPWIFFYFAQDGMLLGGEYLCAIYVLTNLINTLPHTPGGLGIFDGGMFWLFKEVGIGKENGAAFSVATRAADLFLILLGVWLIVHYGLSAVAKRVAKGEEKVSVKDAEPLEENEAIGPRP